MRTTLATNVPLGIRSAGIGFFILAGAIGSGCSLDVAAPLNVVADNFEVPGNASLLVAGSIGDFECAFVDYILASGLLGDEFASTGAVSIAWSAYDRRVLDRSGLSGRYAESTCSNRIDLTPGVYKTLQTARYGGDNAVGLLSGWTDQEVANRQALMAAASAYAGYSTLLLGEGMCSAAIDLSPELTPAQIFEMALTRFSAAINNPQVAPDIRAMALVGRARTRVNLGRLAEAATDAALVPVPFSKLATFDVTSQRRENMLYTRNYETETVTVEDDFRSVTFQGVADPRVRVLSTTRTFPGTPPIQMWRQNKYPAKASAIPLASRQEADLIIAEARLAAGDLQGAINIINALHAATSPALPSFSSADPQAVKAQIIYERRAELWMQSQHLGDVRRYSVPLTPAAGARHPITGEYGTANCFPLPDVERFNNPNIG